jgi:branched-chain amino acid transport system substrate-binding protein
VQFGTLKFDDQRRPENPKVKELVLTDGKFVIAGGKTSAG